MPWLVLAALALVCLLRSRVVEGFGAEKQCSRKCTAESLRDEFPCMNKARTKCCDFTRDQGKRCRPLPGSKTTRSLKSKKKGDGADGSNSNGKSGEGLSCKVSFFGKGLGENEGNTKLADGTPNEKAAKAGNVVAVPTDVYDKMKHKKVVLDGKEYIVRDQCTTCRENGAHYDIMVNESNEDIVNRDYPARFMSCSQRTL